MTTLYRPVLIESAEQAEALPVGTVANLYDPEDAFHDVAVKIDRDDWRTARHDSVMDWNSHYVIGWTALVPIEAEEEWKTLHEGAWHLKADEDDARRDVNSLGARRRYTTDWEEA